MIVIDEDLLQRIRGPGYCERCRTYGPLDPHHVLIKRGIDGGSRLDLPENLAGICRKCHLIVEDDKFENSVLVILAVRRTTPPAVDRVSTVRAWLQSVLAAPKNGPLPARPWEGIHAATNPSGRQMPVVAVDLHDRPPRPGAPDAVQPLLPPPGQTAGRSGLETPDDGWTGL